MADLFEALVAAHRSGAADAAGDGPASVAEAFVWQKRIADALGTHPAGWKVAAHPDAGPVAAPMLAPNVRNAPTDWPFQPGLAVEIEIALRLSRALVPGQETRTSITAAIAASGLGIEMVRPRLLAGASAPFPSILADSLANAGYVAAPLTPGWREVAPEQMTCSVLLNGDALYVGACTHAAGDVLAWLVGYANAPRDAFGGLKPGELITTGALCGVIPVPRPGLMTVSVTGLGSASITFV